MVGLFSHDPSIGSECFRADLSMFPYTYKYIHYRYSKVSMYRPGLTLFLSRDLTQILVLSRIQIEEFGGANSTFTLGGVGLLHSTLLT